ncbi:hypothetical protein KIN20_018012 [Parelaphostrongylus tenuis]|uniref:Uncharacterized protein n=1 Tax=Parelaphostrongylus tenuis TaxID=148309 RepID=A0AAD5QRW4_PARTN|nr:hypothetical protein KIN20_018012 [Parelaphostrongylus tenuis]
MRIPAPRQSSLSAFISLPNGGFPISILRSWFFAEIGCAGEVYLHVPEGPLNIAEYGIMVMVSFVRVGD